jgi:hypothetical protein
MGKIKELYFEMLEKHGEDAIIEDPERAFEEFLKEKAAIKAEEEEQARHEARIDELYKERD